MRFSAYIALIVYLITIVGLLSISLIEELGTGFLVFIWITTISTLFTRERISRRVPPAIWNGLALLLLFVFLVDYLLVSASLVGSAARFLSLLCVLKLYDLKTTRDHLILYIIVFFELLAASASTTSPAFFGIILLFIMSTIWAMIIFNIKRDSSEHRLKEPPPGLFGKPFFAGTVALTMIALVITLVLFFVIPRVELHVFESKTLDTIKVSGFSDTVELGSIGTVKLDSTVVMRVETHAAPPIYIKGGVLATYRDGVWKREEQERTLVRRPARGVFLSGLVTRGVGTQYRIMLEPLDTDILFSPAAWVRIEGNFTGIWTDPTGTLYLPAPPLQRIEYSVWAGKDGVVTAEDELQAYLDLPADTVRIKKLAERIAADHPTAMEKARAIEEYLESSYNYSLSANIRKGSAEPIEDFLFDTKTGWCEQFATSMVIMLRTVGIPARLVTGFAGGEKNPFASYYIFRQKDAHTWVEAHIYERGGWVKFDPTPQQGVLLPSRTSRIGMYIDALHWRWYRYIINYSFSDQIRLASSMETGIREVRHSVVKGIKGLKDGWQGVATIIAVFIALLVALIFLLTRRHHVRKSLPEELWFYDEMVRILSKRGIERLPQETPMEFASRTGIQEVIGLTELFQRVRYGRIELYRDDKERARRLLESLQKRP